VNDTSESSLFILETVNIEDCSCRPAFDCGKLEDLSKKNPGRTGFEVRSSRRGSEGVFIITVHWHFLSTWS
jgi:hypothetical protein